MRRVWSAVPRGEAAAVGAILGLALVLRVGLVLDTVHLTNVGDAADYARHARFIAQTHHYPPSWDGPNGGPTAFRPPLYPFFLTPFFALFGASQGVTAARLAQALLGMGVVALIGVLCVQLWDRRVALIAMCLAAIYPPLITVGAVLLTEVLFVALLLGACAATLTARRSGSLGSAEEPGSSGSSSRWAVVAGVLCGLAALTRSNGALLIIPLALALALGGRRAAGGRGMRNGVFLAVTAVLTVAPWTIRNAVVLHSFVPVSTEGGHTLAGGFNATVERQYPFIEWAPPWAVPEFANLYWRPQFQTLALASPHVPGATPRAWRTDLPEPVLDEKLRSAALHYIGAHPGWSLRRLGFNLDLMFQLRDPADTHISPEELAMHRGWTNWLVTYGFYPLLGLALLGAFTRRARRAPGWLWAVPCLFVTAIVADNMTRLRAPIDVFMIMLAALALALAGVRRRSRGGGASAAPS